MGSDWTQGEERWERHREGGVRQREGGVRQFQLDGCLKSVDKGVPVTSGHILRRNQGRGDSIETGGFNRSSALFVQRVFHKVIITNVF